MLEVNGAKSNEFLEYKGRPLVRQDDDIFYGDLSDKYYIYMMVIQNKKVNKGETELPGTIMVQLLNSETQKPEKQQIITTGLAEALDFADAWLSRYNK